MGTSSPASVSTTPSTTWGGERDNEGMMKREGDRGWEVVGDGGWERCSEEKEK